MTTSTAVRRESVRSAAETTLRWRLVASAIAALILSTLHFIDHIIRGQLVIAKGLSLAWNHSGWPFQAQFSPAFLASLLTVYGLLVVGLVLTLRWRVWAGYWLATAVVLGILVGAVHFAGPTAELPNVIWETYGYPFVGILALSVLFTILVGLVWMAVDAIAVRRISGRW